MDYEDTKRKLLPTWVKNEYGVKSCWPREKAEKMVRKNYEWSYCEPDEVPRRKQYPIGSGELREAGLKRRQSAQQSEVASSERSGDDKQAESEKLSLDDLRTRAKRLGIDKYWCKSEVRLRREVAEAEA
jgi:hypothetical protein